MHLSLKKRKARDKLREKRLPSINFHQSHRSKRDIFPLRLILLSQRKRGFFIAMV